MKTFDSFVNITTKQNEKPHVVLELSWEKATELLEFLEGESNRWGMRIVPQSTITLGLRQILRRPW